MAVKLSTIFKMELSFFSHIIRIQKFKFESVDNYELPKGEQAMYQYEYETVSCDFEGWGFGSGNVYSIEDYRSIISERAKEGWRYVGCIPTKQRGTGHIQEMDIIFEKEL